MGSVLQPPLTDNVQFSGSDPVLHFIELQHFHSPLYVFSSTKLTHVRLQTHAVLLRRSIEWSENLDGLRELIAT